MVAAQLLPLDEGAAPDEVGLDRTDELARRADLEAHDRLQDDQAGRLAGLAEAVPPGRLEGRLGRVGLVHPSPADQAASTSITGKPRSSPPSAANRAPSSTAAGRLRPDALRIGLESRSWIARSAGARAHPDRHGRRLLLARDQALEACGRLRPWRRDGLAVGDPRLADVGLDPEARCRSRCLSTSRCSSPIPEMIVWPVSSWIVVSGRSDPPGPGAGAPPRGDRGPRRSSARSPSR